MSRKQSTQQPDGAALERTESFQFPSAHIGHLTENQQGALDRFKDICTTKGYYIPPTEKTPASHDDETLLRYLRARKFTPQEAFGQFKDTEDWRKENQLNELYESIDVEEYEATRRLYPQWTGRRDKRGIPVYVYEVAGLSTKAIEAYSSSTSAAGMKTKSKVPVKMLRLFALYENLCRFVMPLCSAVPDRQHPETPISQSNNIVDISKVGLKQFWNLKAHMQDASQLATAHYPETLDRIFIIGAPSFFPTVWGWIKRWFDPITVSKIFILSNADMKKTLEQYIDPENIPEKYGGKLDFKFGDLPVLEPSIENYLRWKAPKQGKQGHKTIPTGPIKWQYDESGDLVAVAVGTEKGQPRNTVIASLHPEKGVTTLALNPGRNERAAMVRTTTGVSTHPPTPPESITDRTPSDDSQHGSTASAAPSYSPAAFMAPAGAASQTRETSVPATTTTTDHASVPPAAPPAYDPAPATTTTTSPAAPGISSYVPEGRSVAAPPVYEPSNAPSGYPVPRDDRPQPPATTNNVRAGTSSTRYEQQASTHASGTLAETTPEARIDGGGEKLGVMDPKTVGQAPKEHPVPEAEKSGEETQPAPGYLEQAKGLVGGVAGMALNAVGYGGGGEKEAEQEPAKEKAEDPRVEGMEGAKVEEYLRGQAGSRPA